MTGYGGNFDRPLSMPMMGSCGNPNELYWSLAANRPEGRLANPGRLLLRSAMKKIKIVLALVAFYFLLSAGWQIGACELANIELKDDLQDISTQLGVRIGATDVASDDDLRAMVFTTGGGDRSRCFTGAWLISFPRWNCFQRQVRSGWLRSPGCGIS